MGIYSRSGYSGRCNGATFLFAATSRYERNSAKLRYSCDLLFAAIAYASFPEAVDAYRIGEYEGEGALRIYTWPIRFLIVITALIAGIAYLTMMFADWRGALSEDEALINH